MIDIIMATYNGEKYIREQLDSIISQSYKKWKIIIHDDGSCDNTVDIIKDYAQKYPEKIKYIDDNVKTGGAKNNFAYLLNFVTSDYIMFSDQDDVWENNKVEKAIKTIKSMERKYGDIPVLVHGDLMVVDSELNLINSSMFKMQKLNKKKSSFRDLLVQNNITGCTVIINKKLAEMGKNIPKEAIMHDWWLALIAAAFGKIGFMDNAGILYRQHENNTEGAKNIGSLKYITKKIANKTEIRNTLMLTYMQAEAFIERFGEKLELKNLGEAKAYISMKDADKIKKYSIILGYGFMKSGLIRKIGYLLYC